jgi:hypothetical protein
MTEVDCSAYRQQNDGRWIVLRSTEVIHGGKVAREVIPGDDPETARLTSGMSLQTILRAVCVVKK